MSEPDFKGHARREAAAILAGAAVTEGVFTGYGDLTELLAMAWLSGCIYGKHGEMYDVEKALEEVRAGL